MQQWINHAERKQKKKPRSASLIRLISKAIYLCGDYVGILLAEWIAFHIRNFLMGNIFQVNAIYIYIVTPAVFLLALAFAGIYSKHYTSAQMLEKLFKACLGELLFPSSSCSLRRWQGTYPISTSSSIPRSPLPCSASSVSFWQKG